MKHIEDNFEEFISVYKTLKKYPFFFLNLTLSAIIVSYILTNYFIPNDRLIIINNNILDYPEIKIETGKQYDELFSIHNKILQSDYHGVQGNFFSKELDYKEVEKIVTNINNLIFDDLNIRHQNFMNYYNGVGGINFKIENDYIDRNVNIIRILNIIKKSNNKFFSIYMYDNQNIIEDYIVYILVFFILMLPGFYYKTKKQKYL